MSAFIDERRADFGVEPICRTLGVSASAHYARRGEPSAREVEDERLLALIRRVHEENYEAYGYRRMWKELSRRGELVPRCQVQRLMRDNGIEGAKRRGRPWRTTTPDPDAQRRPDLVERDFTASQPGELVVADFTYVRCWEGLVFFAFVLDVFSRMVVGWQLAAHMRAELVVDALRMALGTGERFGHLELVHHSDRGSQYTSVELAAVMAEGGVLASVGSTGDCYDNAAMETFWSTLKREIAWIRGSIWFPTRDAAKTFLFEYIEVFYNRQRHQAGLGHRTPAEFAAQFRS